MSSPCATCGLAHGPDELFVEVDRGDAWHPVFLDTCVLEAARDAAHAAPQPPGAVAYHATSRVEEALLQGLDPAHCNMRNCLHVCLAETAEIAAGLDLRDAVVLEVDVSGLDLFFELGEARHHDGVIAPERLRVLDPQPIPDASAWRDPNDRRNHSDCLVRMGLPLSRRRLNAAEAALRARWPYDAYNHERFLALLAEQDAMPRVE